MEVTKYDLGLGTTYERLSLNDYLVRLFKTLGIDSVLEGPFDGMKGIAGINSLILGKHGVKTTTMLPDQQAIELAKLVWKKEGCLKQADFICNPENHLKESVQESGFDLVWNFACLPHMMDYKATLDEMIRASKKYVLVFVSNRINYGFWIHYLLHKITGEAWNHGNIRLMDVGLIERHLKFQGLHIIEKPFVDVPWWPDLDLPIGDILGSFMPFLKKQLQQTTHAQHYKWGIENLPYFAPNKEMDGIMKRHGMVEQGNIPLIKYIFAHHQGILAEKG
ncbi:MAG: hypothetical protein QME49_05440 [bacterium]|nr:hypothetical protein [bacterium]